MHRQFILLRGLCREAGHWGELPELLQKSYPDAEVHCLNLPGSGDFYREMSPISLSDYASHLHAQVSQLQQADWRCLISVSFGGMVSLQYRNQFPGQFDQFIIINSNHGALSPFWKRLQPRYYPLVLSLPFFAGLEEQLLRAVCNGAGLSAEAVQKWKAIRAERPVSLRSFINQLLAAAAAKPELKPDQGDILILNSEHDRFVDSSCSRRLAQALGAPIQIHPNGGHDLPEDEPQWVLDAIGSRVSKGEL